MSRLSQQSGLAAMDGRVLERTKTTIRMEVVG
jgi:hypothetical protein